MAINFKRIGYEFRRLETGNTPIETAALIVNQSFNPKQSLDTIIKTKEYENLLKVAAIFYERFSTNSNLHFDNLLRLSNFLPHPQLGTYVFIQVILGSPNVEIEAQKIQLALNKFPSLRDSVFLSRIYSNPSSLFTQKVQQLSLKQTTTVEYLVKCGADSNFLDRFLCLTFQQAIDYFHQLNKNRLHPALVKLLCENPRFFYAIDNFDSYEFTKIAKQVICSENSKQFFDIFFASYKELPKSLTDIVVSDLLSFLHLYVIQVSFEEYQRLFDFILENKVPYITYSNCYGFYNQYFIQSIERVFTEKREMIYETLLKFDIKYFEHYFTPFITEIDLFEIPSKIINDILELKKLAIIIQAMRPKFLTFVLNRFPKTVGKVAAIVKSFGISTISNLKFNTNIYALQPNEKSSENSDDQDDFPDVNTEGALMAGPNSYPRISHKATSTINISPPPPQDQPNQLHKLPRFVELIYQIDQVAFSHCFNSNTNQIFQFLVNFVPAKFDSKILKKVQISKDDASEIRLKRALDKQTRHNSANSIHRCQPPIESSDAEQSQQLNVNPSHLDFPSIPFIDECIQLKLITIEQLEYFICKNVNYIIKNKEWMKLISNHSILFKIFSKVIFHQPQFNDQYLKVTIEYIVNMLPKFSRSQDVFIDFVNFLIENSSIIDFNSFPLYLKIELVVLLFKCPIEIIFTNFLPLILIICEDYRTLESLEGQTKLMLFEQNFFRDNLHTPSVHTVYLMIFEHQLFTPNEYVDLIGRNLNGIRKSLRDNSEVFRKWFNYVFQDENAQIIRFIVDQMRQTGQNEVAQFILNVLLDALAHIQFQENIEYLTCLFNQLEPNINQDDNPRIGKMDNIDLRKMPLKSFLKKKREVDENAFKNPEYLPLKELYNTIYEVLRRDYTKNVFQAIPFVPPSTQLPQQPREQPPEESP